MLDLVWFAFMSNGDVIRQFEDAEQKVEHRFQEVLDRSNELTAFCLVNIHSDRVYAVDLERGSIQIYTEKPRHKAEQEVLGAVGPKYRLINFRRIERDMTWNGGPLKEKGACRIQYFLGYQYTEADGRNFKKLIQISKEDEVHMT